MAAKTSKIGPKTAGSPGKRKPKATSSGRANTKSSPKGAASPSNGKPKAKPSGKGSRESSSKRTAPVKPKTYAEDPGEPLSLEEITAATGLTAEDIAELPELARRALSPVRVLTPIDFLDVEWHESMARGVEKALDAREKEVAEPAPAETPPPDFYCRAITHRGSRTLTKAQYAALLRRRSAYDMFINGMTRETICRKGKAKPRSEKLGPKELRILIDVIEARKPVALRKTETGRSCPSRTTASHLFERARAKADLQLGRNKYRAFRLHRGPTAADTTYEFDPPNTLKFCVIIPPKA